MGRARFAWWERHSRRLNPGLRCPVGAAALSRSRPSLPRLRRALHVWTAACLLGLVAFALLLAAAPVQAQTVVTLVSTIGQTSGTTGDLEGDNAQAFTTSSNTPGYRLTVLGDASLGLGWRHTAARPHTSPPRKAWTGEGILATASTAPDAPPDAVHKGALSTTSPHR